MTVRRWWEKLSPNMERFLRGESIGEGPVKIKLPHSFVVEQKGDPKMTQGYNERPSRAAHQPRDRMES